MQHGGNAGQEAGLRVRRSRKRGSAMPAGTLYVGRGSIFGNPFIGETTAAVAAYRAWLTGNCQVSVGPDQPIKRLAFIPALETPERIKAVLPQLRGRRLACWCALDQP